jgi:predicted MFS family arabinose efflux permease
MWMAGTAQGWLVLRLTDSPASLGLTSFVNMAPVLLLSLYAGVLADRVDRRRLLLAAQVVILVTAAVLALLVTLGLAAFWQILLATLVIGTAQALTMPAFQAFVSALVPREALGNAIALNSAQFNLSRIVGPAIAGVLVGTVGEAPAFWLQALAVAWLIVVLARMRVAPSTVGTRSEAGLWTNLTDGFRYARSDRSLSALLLLAAAPAFFVLPYVTLLPVYARDILGIGAAGLGVLTASVGVGALTGAVTVAFGGSGRAGGRLVTMGLIAMALSVAVFAASRSLVVSCVALAVRGAAQVAYYTSTNTLVQLLSPARLRGRILSIYTLTSIGFLPLGSLAAGAPISSASPPATLVGGAVLALGSLLLVVGWTRGLLALTSATARPHAIPPAYGVLVTRPDEPGDAAGSDGHAPAPASRPSVDAAPAPNAPPGRPAP